MSEGYSFEGINSEETADAEMIEAAYADDKLGFEPLPEQIVIDSDKAVEEFKQMHGIDLSSYLENN